MHFWTFPFIFKYYFLMFCRDPSSCFLSWRFSWYRHLLLTLIFLRYLYLFIFFIWRSIQGLEKWFRGCKHWCSSGIPRCDSQHPPGDSPLSVTPVSEDLILSSGLIQHQAHTWHTDMYASKTVIHIKIKVNKCKKKSYLFICETLPHISLTEFQVAGFCLISAINFL